MPLSTAAGNEAGPVGIAHWVVQLCTTLSAVISCKMLSVLIMRASGGEYRFYS